MWLHPRLGLHAAATHSPDPRQAPSGIGQGLQCKCFAPSNHYLPVSRVNLSFKKRSFGKMGTKTKWRPFCKVWMECSAKCSRAARSGKTCLARSSPLDCRHARASLTRPPLFQGPPTSSADTQLQKHRNDDDAGVVHGAVAAAAVDHDSLLSANASACLAWLAVAEPRMAGGR